MYCTSHQHNILMQGFCSSLEVWIKSPKLLTCCVCCIFIDGASAGTLISFTLCLNLKTALTLPPTSKNKIEQNKQKFEIDPFPVPQKRIKHDFFSQGNRRDRWGESRDGSHNCLQESQLCIFRCLWLSQLWRNPKLRFFKAAVWACSSRGAWNNCSKKYKLLHSSQKDPHWNAWMLTLLTVHGPSKHIRKHMKLSPVWCWVPFPFASSLRDAQKTMQRNSQFGFPLHILVVIQMFCHGMKLNCVETPEPLPEAAQIHQHSISTRRADPQHSSTENFVANLHTGG